MYAPDGRDTFWLDFTNAALGLMTLVFVISVAGSVVRELHLGRGHVRRRMRRLSKFHDGLRR